MALAWKAREPYKGSASSNLALSANKGVNTMFDFVKSPTLIYVLMFVGLTIFWLDLNRYSF